MNLAHDMLRKLGSGVRPEAPAAIGRAGVSERGFADLLRAAEAGEISTGRSVDVEKGANLTLTDAQRARLAGLSDKAQLAGVSRVLVQTGGVWLCLNADARTVSKADAITPNDIITGIDGVAPEIKNTEPTPTGAGLLLSLGGRASARIAHAND
jgi:hypothetical protein